MIEAVSEQSYRKQPFPYRQPNEKTVESLQRQIANAFNLYLNYKHYHWQTSEPMFRDLNIIFDEFATEVYSTVEVLAQRVRMIGRNRVCVREFPQNASVKPAGNNNSVRAMIEEADSNALIVIEEMREAAKNARSVDPASASILKTFFKNS